MFLGLRIGCFQTTQIFLNYTLWLCLDR